jgi:peptide-methionine (S)-S-oxide reductase
MEHQKLETAILGGGCFWCIEAVYNQLQGVHSAISGYSGGKEANPSYREVCYGKTDHVEVVEVAFDNSIITFEDILRVFFSIHDPTTLHRQGNDIGSQYRSVIFYGDAAQQAAAAQIIAEAQDLWPSPIVTAVEPAMPFYAAEDYHQEYFKHHGHEPYCSVVVAPKVSKFRKQWASRLKPI